MRKVWTNKIKACPRPADVTASVEGKLKPVQPKIKRQLRTSVAIATLAISVGMPNLTVQGQSNSVVANESVAQSGLVDRDAVGYQVRDTPQIVDRASAYLVKAGDTLSAIAFHHKVSLPEIIKANRLTNPDLIHISQQLKIPVVQDSSNNIATHKIKTTSLKPSLPFVLPTSSASVESKEAVVATLIKGDLKQKILFVPPKSLTETAAPVRLDGVGGSISDEEESKLNQSETQYVQRLQSDIQRLRQKYSQRTVVNSATDLTNAVPAGDKAGIVKESYSGDGPTVIPLLRGRRVNPQSPSWLPAGPSLPSTTPSSITAKGYIWPTKGKITSGYGWRWGRMHRGIDIAAPVGTPVVAAAGGIVVKAGWVAGGYGNLVDIKHADGSLTRYGHNKKVLVHAGQEVEQGQQISEMGSTGFSTGPHLHFEVHPVGKKAVNPMAFLPRR